MKVAKDWLKELVDLKVDIKEVERLLPLRTIATKEITDRSIELDMKGYNRADLLSMRGVALEVAAITDSKIKFGDLTDDQLIWVEQQLDKLDVSIEDENLCPLYCVAKIEGLKVEPSSDEWVQKLSDSGLRSISNVADVTNLVMLEFGQPLHAFNASEVRDEKIIVRNANMGEKIITLDGKTRELEENDLLIADPEKALGIAGVMGGKNSEVPDSGEVTILLEAAIFDPVNLRKTATRLGLTSEASKRFYHGLTKKRLFQALDAAIRMYLKLGGKLTALTIVGENGDHLKKIPLSLRKVIELIGVEISKKQVEEFLRRLYFEFQEETTAQGEPGWVVTPPYFRLDIEIEEDLVEEVARMYGYENIKAKMLPGKIPEKIDQSLFELIHNLKQSLVNLGLTEVQTYSFYSTKVLEALAFNENTKNVLVKVANPMSSETEYMRMNIWPNLIEVIDKNLRQGIEDIAIFEVGKEYIPIEKGKPLENYALAIALMNGSDNPLAEVNQIFEKIGAEMLKLNAKPTVAPEVLRPLFHPKRFLSIYKGEEKVGGMAEVHLRVLDKFGIGKRVAILQIDLGSLV